MRAMMIQHQMRHRPAWWRDKEKLIGQPAPPRALAAMTENDRNDRNVRKRGR